MSQESQGMSGYTQQQGMQTDEELPPVTQVAGLRAASGFFEKGWTGKMRAQREAPIKKPDKPYQR